MNYREKLIKKYYSTHFCRFMPKTQEEWEGVIKRIELNFDEFFDMIPKDSFILDVACGVGFLEYYLLKKGFTKIDAVDLSLEQIQIAQTKLKEYGLDFVDRVTFYHLDAFKFLKEAKRRYSAIVMLDFLEHLSKDEIIEILDLSYNTLQTVGLLFLRVPNADTPTFGRSFYHDFTHQTPFTPDTLYQCLTATGFEPVKIAYEVYPVSSKKIVRFKRMVKYGGLWVLGKFLDISQNAFAENLGAVGRKR